MAHLLADASVPVFKYDKEREWDGLVCVADCDIVFLCLPTPYDPRLERIDMSAFDDVIPVLAERAQRGAVIVLKSTVLPGTTRDFSEAMPRFHWAAVPDFLRESSSNSDALRPDRVVIGTETPYGAQVLGTLYHRLLPKVPIFVMTSTEAELVKYMSNCFLATKVIFGNCFSEYAEALKCGYWRVRQAVGADKRIGDSHLQVTAARGFGGKCFPKDMLAFVSLMQSMGQDTSLLENVWAKNLRIREIRDWEWIPGAITPDEPKERE